MGRVYDALKRAAESGGAGVKRNGADEAATDVTEGEGRYAEARLCDHLQAGRREADEGAVA